MSTVCVCDFPFESKIAHCVTVHCTDDYITEDSSTTTGYNGFKNVYGEAKR